MFISHITLVNAMLYKKISGFLLLNALFLLLLIYLFFHSSCWKISSPFWFENFALFGLFASSFVLQNQLDILYYQIFPKNDNLLGYNKDLLKMITTPIKIKKTRKNLRNIIVIDIESLEKLTLGCESISHPDLLPYLSSLWKKGTRFLNAPVKEIIYSEYSLMVTQCGIPILPKFYPLDLISIPFKINGQNYTFPCSFDFFDKAGFETRLFHQNSMAAYPKPYESLKAHVPYFSAKIHSDVLYQEVLNYLNKRERQKPFYYLILIQDTHPPQFYRPKSCTENIDISKLSNLWGSFQCQDYYLQKFMSAFEKTPYIHNTDIIIIGDHPILAFYDKRDFPPGVDVKTNSSIILPHKDIWQMQLKRNFLYMFPTLPNRSIKYSVSPYDFYHTLLDLAGIEEYEPKNPLGFSFFNDHQRPHKWLDDKDINSLHLISDCIRSSNTSLIESTLGLS
jgi:hypothetical protein